MRPVYQFTIRSLPLDVYNVIRRLKADYQMTNWQAVILGIAAVVHLAKTDPTAFQSLIGNTKLDYPDHVQP